ncbi:MAG TPA: hypothetical protein VK203_06235 [Nostocaceae cyanobacterium]|nr:hypothetical protein [Nostocaceae cyanobacterium]
MIQSVIQVPDNISPEDAEDAAKEEYLSMVNWCWETLQDDAAEPREQGCFIKT